MVDVEKVCCMCGDIGFPDKLFHCNNCRNRFQHSSSSMYIHGMVDVEKVCCMCGDIGFPDKLFHCNNCRNRFQHSYCSNYYSKSSGSIEVCDWCQSEERSSRHGGSSKKAMAKNDGLVINKRSEQYSGGRIKQHEESSDQKGKNPTAGVPSPRTATRRYKLLKDVMF